MPVNPTLGEIALFPYSRALDGWAICDGRTLPILQNQALFSLLGTYFGGDGRTTFGLPDLRGRVPVGARLSGDKLKVNPAYIFGEKGGLAAVSLLPGEMPAHSHAFVGTTAAANTANIQNAVYASIGTLEPGFPTPTPLYANLAAPSAFDPASLQTTGAGLAHNNMQPTVALCYMIATQGMYPVRP